MVGVFARTTKYSRIMRQFRLLICLMLLVMAGLFCPAPSYAVALKNIRFASHDAGHRIVLEIDGEPDSYRVFTLDNPDRLVIDLVKTSWQAGDVNAYKHPLLFSQMRRGIQNGLDLRVVMDVVNPPNVADVMLIEPEKKGQPYQIQVDIGQVPGDEEPAPDGADGQPEPEPKRPLNKLDFELQEKSTAVPATPARPPSPWSRAPTPVAKPGMPGFATLPVVAIDAGHGGADPGAASRHGVREKELTLAFAKKLKDTLEKTGKAKVVLTRSTDKFIALRERIAIARKHKAHLFISIHADSTTNRLTRGLSVYTLSDDASDKEAEMLAARENKADIIGGLDLSKQSDEVTGILIDLAQRDTRAKSSIFADTVIDSLMDSTLLVKNAHRHAGFAVLKAPDVPSVLVELGFLSNDEDERMLRSEGYQKKLIEAMAKAVLDYFKHYPPMN
jgi:N-acetylmuramoyl-L-alanine amidase